ncbi:MAG: hypothetical protein HEEMFOPI_01882 [Holosporales bacterium]
MIKSFSFRSFLNLNAKPKRSQIIRLSHLLCVEYGKNSMFAELQNEVKSGWPITT